MNTSLGLNLLVLLLAIMLARYALDVLQRRQMHKQLSELATQKGWQFEKTPSAYVDDLLRSQAAGEPWVMKYSHQEPAPGKPKITNLLWSSEAAQSSAGTLIVCPKAPNVPAPKAPPAGTGEVLLDSLLQQLGLEPTGLHLQAVGSAPFQKKYAVMAADAALAEKVVAGVETELLNWPAVNSPYNLPCLTVDDKGLQVRLNRTGTSANYQCQVAEPMVRLGLAAVRGLQ